MASSKKIGFYWGEEKITVVEFEKNTPVKVVSSPLASKANAASPFSSNLTEEIQITAALQKMLQDNQITGGSFYVSLPMKDIILRSFIIPFVKPDEIQVAVKFEAKKYMPFDIQDMSFVFFTVQFAEGQNKRLQVIFFAARKEVLNRYERIFKQVNAQVSYCEPYIVSLAKALLFKKEIKPIDRLAFLNLGKNLGRICFIDQGIPQFIREFPITSLAPSEETRGSEETLNSKIVNEVGNSFDFYARQFSGERIDRMLVFSDFAGKDLLDDLGTELKVKITKFSPSIATGGLGSNNDMDAIYAMGACVVPPMEPLTRFNFLGTHKPQSFFEAPSMESLTQYKEILYVLLMCLVVLAGAFFFFQAQSRIAQNQYNQLTAKEGAFLLEPLETIEADTKEKTDQLHDYKDIRTKSNIIFIILRVASHLPEGALLNNLVIRYDSSDSINARMTIDMSGDIFIKDPNEEIEAVNKVYSDLKSDKELSRFITSVTLVSLNREEFKGQQVTGFNIHCS